MKTITKKLQELTSSEKMTTLSSSIALAEEKGYIAEFAIQPDGMLWGAGNDYYHPEEVTVDNFYRFEGESDPADNAILYLISTSNNKKGTLVDAYGAYDNAAISGFIRRVSHIHKQTNTADKYTYRNDRQRYVIAAGLLAVSGLLLLVMRKKRKL